MVAVHQVQHRLHRRPGAALEEALRQVRERVAAAQGGGGHAAAQGETAAEGRLQERGSSARRRAAPALQRGGLPSRCAQVQAAHLYMTYTSLMLRSRMWRYRKVTKSATILGTGAGRAKPPC